jgi:hypothetical protein
MNPETKAYMFHMINKIPIMVTLWVVGLVIAHFEDRNGAMGTYGVFSFINGLYFADFKFGDKK